MGRKFVPMVALTVVGVVAYRVTRTRPRASRPPTPDITAQTVRNKDASLTLAEYADCAYRAIGKAQLCATASSPR